MLFTKGPCPCCASAPLPLLARIAPPILYKLKETSARMIRWGSSMGKCRADHWKTKFAREGCPFVQLNPIWRVLEFRMRIFSGSCFSISGLWCAAEVSSWNSEVHRHCKPSSTCWFRFSQRGLKKKNLAGSLCLTWKIGNDWLRAPLGELHKIPISEVRSNTGFCLFYPRRLGKCPGSTRASFLVKSPEKHSSGIPQKANSTPQTWRFYQEILSYFLSLQ